ncbi:MAG: alpha/beta hydrolase [Sandaracinaceae bacterium]|nr:alpha/beta hydrolase [Sandaracinaceae bacterium]
MKTPVAFVLAALGLLSGCGVLRPTHATISTHYYAADRGHASVDEASGRAACLLVMLPGIGDSAQSFERHGFVEEARRAGLGCDVALVDAHFTYYLIQNAVERVSTDVLQDARDRGYRSVWLVGVSLGGYGAMLTARAHPELVDGLVLLAPMVGVPPSENDVAQEILAAGGLHRWSGLDTGADDPRHHFREARLAWDWLRVSTLDPRSAQTLVLAFGTEDTRAARYEVISEVLPAQAVFRCDGAHDWPTWRRLWREVLRAHPWRRGAPASEVVASTPIRSGG